MHSNPTSLPMKTIRPHRIVITGARGRISTGILPRLEEHFGEVIRVSRTAGDGCISYEDAFASDVFVNADCIVHGAWSMLPALSENHLAAEWCIDLPLLAKILQSISVAAHHNRKIPTCVLLSSAGAIYGNAGEFPSSEFDAPHPIGWYGHGKLAAESLMASYQQLTGLPSLILRISNPYGFAYRRHRPQGLIAAAFHAANENTALPIWGDGTALKDYIHISDLAEAICCAVAKDLRGVFNISFGQSYSILDVIAQIEQLIGRQLALEFLDVPHWDIRRSLVSRDKITQALDWHPLVDLAAGLKMEAVSSGS